MNNKPKILCLFGLSGSSKSTIEANLIKNMGFKKIISCTTRKVRDNEINGKDYYYISEDEFKSKEQQGLFAEVGGKYGGRYGVLYSEIKEDKINVLVTAKDGIEELQELDKYNLLKIWIDCDICERFLRISKRNTLEYALKRIEKDGFRRDEEIYLADYVIDTTELNQDEVMSEVFANLEFKK